MKNELLISNSKVLCFAENDSPDIIIIQPTGKHEENFICDEYNLLKQQTDKNFAFITYEIKNWDIELSPWKAKQAFGDEYFGNGASNTLSTIQNNVIPNLSDVFNIKHQTKFLLGGYSLAGLFSLWSAYQTDIFCGIAACSPSIWFEKWFEYAKNNSIKTENIYLSLGSREHKTRNQMMKTVKDNILLQKQLLENKNVFLEFNQGNHFQDNTERKVKGFLWLLENIY